MNKTTKARKYSSAKLQELLDEVTPLEMKQTKVKMQLAARIEDFMITKGWNNSQFAEKVGKNPSEITKWFSGTQNFTIDVLTEIASALGIELTALFGKKQDQVIYRKEIVVKSVAPKPMIIIATPKSQSLDVSSFCLSTVQGNKSAYTKSYQA
jgi:transcriptional regulator with XRE-family HTH domain